MKTNCTIMSPFRRRMGARRGFSVTELMVCALILSLSTTVITSTLSLGVQTFQTNTRRSEQLMLLNTLSVSVQEYLTYAQEVRTAAGGGLDTFTTGAMGALTGASCRLITARSNDNGVTYQETEDFGELALFISRDNTETIYPLVDRSQYIIRSRRSPEPVLKADLDVQVTDQRQFEVTITVSSREGDTGDAENKFFVTPVYVKSWN